MRRLGVTPHVAQHTNGRRSAIDERSTRHPGYAVSQRIRKRIEEVFGWGKEIGGMRRTLLRGLERVGWDCRKFRVWGRTMLLKEPSFAATQIACDPG